MGITKAKAKNAAQSSGEGYFKGGYTGGQSKHEERGVVHGKEFVHMAETTDRYSLQLFKPLHKNRPQDIDWKSPHMQALLPDYALPGKLHAEKRAVVELRLQVQMQPLQAELQAMQAKLTAIEKHVSRIADRRDVVPVPGGYLEVDPATKNTTLTRLEGLG